MKANASGQLSLGKGGFVQKLPERAAGEPKQGVNTGMDLYPLGKKAYWPEVSYLHRSILLCRCKAGQPPKISHRYMEYQDKSYGMLCN